MKTISVLALGACVGVAGFLGTLGLARLFSRPSPMSTPHATASASAYVVQAVAAPMPGIAPAPSGGAALGAAIRTEAGPPSAAMASAEELAVGRSLFVFNCMPCHGVEAQGNIVYGAPALAGQRADYLARQLQKFREGSRGAHPADVQGMQMAAILRLLPDEASSRGVVAHLAGLPPFSTEPTLDADPAQGAVAFATTCLACHGPKGEGNPLLKSPRLAGQADWYLVRQLTKFKSGIRGASPQDVEGLQMAAMSKTLFDDEVLRSVAAYINQLK